MSDLPADNLSVTKPHSSDNERRTRYDWLAIGSCAVCVAVHLLVVPFERGGPWLLLTVALGVPLTLGIATLALSGRVISRTTEAILFLGAVLTGGLDCLVFCIAYASRG